MGGPNGNLRMTVLPPNLYSGGILEPLSVSSILRISDFGATVFAHIKTDATLASPAMALFHIVMAAVAR